MKKYFYEETGMYIDWPQIYKLPEIETLIDIGVGKEGTPLLYDRFPKAKLVLIDPIEEAEQFAKNNLNGREYQFFKFGVGNKEEIKMLNVEEEIGRSTLLNVTSLNYEGDPIKKFTIQVKTLDNICKNYKKYGKIGLKIDTEGYELKIIKGAKEVLKKTSFVIAEVRHNHKSYDQQYLMHEFINEMHENGFVLSMILTAKPLIADLCFEKKENLCFNN